ncbi:unnamed protein product [Calypogeia fissa]
MGSSKDPEQGDVVEGQPVGAYYGTFQGQPGYPQPVPPSEAPYYAPADQNYSYQSVQGIHSRISEGRPLLGGEHYQREEKLPFCNLGFGWFLFILGFFSVIPWYIGTIIFFCLAHDSRERTGLMACAIAALIVLLLGGSKAGGGW